MRFIKKAAPNLSQEFKVYVPSKRLPLNEQKRMLAKQLHDFLHVYRKDTEQLRVETNAQLDAERKNSLNKLIDEKAFQTLLYKCNEAELEEIMSIYMKNSQDSSVFLGAAKPNNSAPQTAINRSSSAVASLSSMHKFENREETNQKPKLMQQKSTPTPGPEIAPRAASVSRLHQPQNPPDLSHLVASAANIETTPTKQPKRELKTRAKPPLESDFMSKKAADEYSNVSCDSHSRSIFSNSSGDEEIEAYSKSSNSRSRSNSNSSSDLGNANRLVCQAFDLTMPNLMHYIEKKADN